MPWLEPKTDWQPSDCYNAAALNRVEMNLANLAALPEVYRFPVALEPGVTDRTIRSIEFASSLNRVERNLDSLREALYTPFGWQVVRTDWAPVRQSFGYQDANRLEVNLLLLRQLILTILTGMPQCGTLTCGEEVSL